MEINKCERLNEGSKLTNNRPEDMFAERLDTNVMEVVANLRELEDHGSLRGKILGRDAGVG